MKAPFLAVTLLALSTTFACAKGAPVTAQAHDVNTSKFAISIKTGDKVPQADTMSLAAKVAAGLGSRG